MQRHFTLPDNFDPDNIRAGSKDGVLTITVGKIDLPQPKALPFKRAKRCLC
ncbi:MAG: Hsp20/alpha crystallin family protein [Candidatus Oxydemutatoraceae bacterium WSBS_2016_MAG_OTU14]